MAMWLWLLQGLVTAPRPFTLEEQMNVLISRIYYCFLPTYLRSGCSSTEPRPGRLTSCRHQVFAFQFRVWRARLKAVFRHIQCSGTNMAPNYRYDSNHKLWVSWAPSSCPEPNILKQYSGTSFYDHDRFPIRSFFKKVLGKKKSPWL